MVHGPNACFGSVAMFSAMQGLTESINLDARGWWGVLLYECDLFGFRCYSIEIILMQMDV